MALSRGRRCWLVLSICVVTASVLTTLAIAGEKQAVISATAFETGEGERIEEYALCPGRQRALGGGVVQSGQPPFAFIQASGPLDASGTPGGTKDGDIAKRWFVAIKQVIDQTEWKVFVICARVPGAKIETASFTTDEEEVGKKSVRCPDSRRALGGGVVPIGSGEGTSITASGPLDRSGEVSKTKTGDVAKSWFAAVRDMSGENLRRFKVFVICAKGSSATISTNKASADPGADVQALEQCDGPKRAVGGGILPLGAPGDFTLRANGPLDDTATPSETKDGDVADIWYAAAFNATGSLEAVKVSAICV